MSFSSGMVVRCCASTRQFRASAAIRAYSDVAVGRDVSWCAHYINLQRRPDRRARLLKLIGATSPRFVDKLSRIGAVDGAVLDVHDPFPFLHVVNQQALDRARQASLRGAYTIAHNNGHLLHFDNHLTRGGLACAISHRLALQAIAAHPSAEWGLVLEDDIVAAIPHADIVLPRLVESLPSDWGAVMLGYHDCGGAPHMSALRSVDTHTDGLDTDAIGLSVCNDFRVNGAPGPLFGLFAWIVRKDVARSLLSEAFPIGGQVDHALTSWCYERGRLYAVRPSEMLFFSEKSEVGLDSDIQTMATVDAMLGKHGSWADYHSKVWGLEAQLEMSLGVDVVGGDFSGDWLLGSGDEQALLGLWSDSMMFCDAPAPDCFSLDFDQFYE